MPSSSTFAPSSGAGVAADAVNVARVHAAAVRAALKRGNLAPVTSPYRQSNQPAMVHPSPTCDADLRAGGGAERVRCARAVRGCLCAVGVTPVAVLLGGVVVVEAVAIRVVPANTRGHGASARCHITVQARTGAKRSPHVPVPVVIATVVVVNMAVSVAVSVAAMAVSHVAAAAQRVAHAPSLWTRSRDGSCLAAAAARQRSVAQPARQQQVATISRPLLWPGSRIATRTVRNFDS